MTDTPMAPDRVRADALQPDDQIRHPHDWTLFTVSSVETLDSLGSPLDFHNRKTDEMERGLRVTGTDADGETVHVDCAPSHLWHREGRQATTAMTPDAALARLRQYGERTSTWSTATYNDGTEKALHQIAVSLAGEVDRLRAQVAELTAAPVDEAAEMAEAEAELEAMRREHPAPCRVPDSPDCTCPDKLPVFTGADWDGPIARCSWGAHMAALLPSGRIARHRMGEGWLNACPGVGKPPRAEEETAS
ncbi:hypothetical protein PV677_36330 [Streptomyces sp. DE06-01C]|uniref:hypothetical protein n=1 Tax=Streptomyces sp. DE06-01C TaxID=3028656 RepID=UPI0029C41BA0|nr:hypothetical protein [Streptomyces sp. DE06-01C]MDX5526139.1 hypothetical protein [Streptomyces sp. DE06-01C]